MSYQNSNTLSGQLYSYSDILLKTYVEIANTGNIQLMIKSGSVDAEKLNEAWEAIIEENGKHTKNNSYNIYQNLIYDYGLLIAQHTVVSICLEMLTWKIDLDIVNEVRDRGYKIELGQKFESSLKSAKSKCKNLITKSESKKKEIERRFKDEGTKSNPSYDEILGYLELALDRTIMDSDTITLAKYNVLKKGAEQRQKAHGSNTNRGARA